MKKEHIQLAVIGIGVCMLAYSLQANLKKAVKRPVTFEMQPAPVVSVPGGALPGARTRDSIWALQTERWKSGWGRDPFWEASDTAGKLNEFELKGISFSRNTKGYALINDQIFSVGDMMGGYEISRVEKDRVMLTRGTQTFFLTFSEKK